MSVPSAHDAGYAMGTVLGLTLLVAGPVAFGMFMSRRLNQSRNFENSIRWPTYVGIAVAAVLLLGYCSGNPASALPSEIYHG